MKLPTRQVHDLPPRGARHRARLLAPALALVTAAGVIAGAPAATAEGAAPADGAADVWSAVSGKSVAAQEDDAQVKPSRFRAFSLDVESIADSLAEAPADTAPESAARKVVSLPKPGGGFARFEVEESSILEPKLAARHPEIQTYRGQGIDDPSMTLRADVTALGFHASVRSDAGAWYIDPYTKDEDGVYVSYFGRDLPHDPVEKFIEKDIAEGASARDGDSPASGSTVAAAAAEVQLRIFRLALVTDPSYANYFGAANVTSAKVTLINRVNHVYEDDLAIRLVLVGDTDKLNLNTPEQMTGANGPCGSAPCYTPAQASGCAGATLTRNRIVVGQLIGASSYDVGHIAFGLAGGGVAQEGAGQNTKANGCTGLTTPVGDVMAIDYVGHEMAHQFAGSHTFNGNQSNCAGGNRSAANSVEPGSGSSIMSYAGICRTDNLQPHSDPYFHAQSIMQITNYVTADRAAINEVQTFSLRDFSGGDEVQQISLTGFNSTRMSFQLSYGERTSPSFGAGGLPYTAEALQAVITAITGYPGTVTVTGVANNGFTVTFSGGNADLMPLGVVNCAGVSATGAPATCTGSSTEVLKGGPLGDAFRISYNGQLSAPITRENYNAAAIKAAIESIPSWPVGATVTVAAWGGTGALNDFGFQVTFGGTLAQTNIENLQIVEGTGVSGFVGETAKGGPVDNKGYQVVPTGNHAPEVTAPAEYTIPYQTPFSLTASGSDVDGQTVTYLWEQMDRGITPVALADNNKTNGPLFRQFGRAAEVSPQDTIKYNSPGENVVTTEPTRVFPDMGQILSNNSNAKTGTCPPVNISGTQTLPLEIRECYAEFLPTPVYAGPMNFRVTVRDHNAEGGGTNFANTRVNLAPGTGPFLVASQGTAATVQPGSSQTITWDVAGTNLPPISAENVRITLSTNGGATFPYTLSASTANDGSEQITLPAVATTSARIKIEAVGNIFFDVSDANLTIQPTVTGITDGATYGDSQTLSICWTSPAGVTTTATLDGAPFAPCTPFQLYTIPLGQHTLVVTSTDASGSSTSQTFTFTTVTSFSDIRALIGRFQGEGRVTAAVAASLLDRLNRAEVEAAGGSETRTIAFLEQFVQRAFNQIRGDASDIAARDVLVRDARWLIAYYRSIDEAENG